jgi:glycosyltransferase involved in cell wall biosynthesis
MKPKHILVVSQYFYPEDFRINDMCVEWVKRGYRVTVVTGIPNYPEGKFYKGYGWCCKRRENWNGVEIIRLPLIPRGKSAVGMVMNYLSFVVSGFFWKTFTRLKADLVFTFEVSPMTQALVGVGYSRRRKIPHYLYVQDLWPENVESITGITSPLVIQPISCMVNYIYKHCHKIFATSPSFVKAIQSRTPGQEEKVLYWPQYAEDFYMPQPRQPLPEIPEDDTFKIIFTGNIGQAQGLEILPRTAQRLKKLGIRDVRFVIVGDGRNKSKLLEDIRSRDVGDMFQLIGRQPSQRIPELLAACDMAYLSFNDDPIFAKTIPAKLQSYMACGAPILANATGESRRIIRAARCGVCCEIGSVDSLVKVIRNRKRLNLPAMSKNARAYFENHFRRNVLMDEMDRHFAGNS